ATSCVRRRLKLCCGYPTERRRMQSRSGTRVWAGRSIGFRDLSQLSRHPRPAISLPSQTAQVFFIQKLRRNDPIGRKPPMREMKLQDLKSKTPAELVAFAEEHQVENASTMRKQELMFAILKQLATQEVDIIGEGVVEVLSDGFGFLRSPESN